MQLGRAPIALAHAAAAPSLLVEWFFVLESALGAPASRRAEVARLLAAAPGLAGRIGGFWDDGAGGFVELLVLGEAAGALVEDDPAAVRAAIADAAARPAGEPRLSTEAAERRAAVCERLRALAAEPTRRREYLGLLEDVADAALPAWRAGGAARAALVGGRWTEELRARSFVEVLALGDGPERAGLTRALTVVESSTPVLLVPATTAADVVLVDLGSVLVVGAPVGRRSRLGEDAAAELVRRAKALGDPTRLAIVDRLASGPCGVGELAVEVGLAQPTVSNHVRVLREAGLVRDTPRGTRRGVVLDVEGLRALLEGLGALAGDGGGARPGH